MLPLGSRPRDPDLHRRRPAPRRRRLPWPAFWLRGNRRTRDPAAVATPQDAADTARPDPGPPEPAGPGAAGAGPGAAPPATGTLARPGIPLRLLGALGAVIAAAGLLGGVLYLLRHSAHFALREVRTSSLRHVSREALIARARLPFGENLFRLDLVAAQRALGAEPWLRRVRVRRELPATVVIDAEEHEPAVLVALGALYLSDREGVIFKRATPDEAVGLPVVTGIGREAYLSDRAEAQDLVREAVAAYRAYRTEGRPPASEIHVDLFSGPTLYVAGGVAVRLGHGDAASLPSRLQAFDAVWAELVRRGERPAVVFLDNRARPDHVTVRLKATP